MSKIKNLRLYEAIFVIVIFSVIYFVTMNKYSYAFSYDSTYEQSKNEERLLTKAAQLYAENNKSIFKDKDTVYITVDDLVNAKLIKADENGKVYLTGSDVKTINDMKIRLVYKDEKITVKLLST